MLDDPQVRHLETFYRQSTRPKASITAIHRPVLIDGGRDGADLPPPTLGEHTEAVLAELGYDDADIASLRKSKVI